MKNRFLKLLALIAVPLMLSGCSKYNDDRLIAKEDNKGTLKFSNMNVPTGEDGRRRGEVGEMDGFRQILEANIDKDREVDFHINLTANSGKAKIVLVKPNAEIDVLAEVVAEKGNERFEGDVSAKCMSGLNKIKIVGENYDGNFEIYQPNGVIFNNVNEFKLKYQDPSYNGNDMFGEGFPFEK